MAAKIFVKNLLFLIVYQRRNNALKIKLVKTGIKQLLTNIIAFKFLLNCAKKLCQTSSYVAK